MVENVIRLIRELDEQIDELKHTVKEDVTKLNEQLEAVEHAITELEKTNITVPPDLFHLRDHFREHKEEITQSEQTLQTLKTELTSLLNKFDGEKGAETEEEKPEESAETEEEPEPLQTEKTEEEEPVETEEPEEELPGSGDFLQSGQRSESKSFREILGQAPAPTSGSGIIRMGGSEQEPEPEQPPESLNESEESEKGATPPEELRRVLLEILKDCEGSATSNEIRTKMEERLGPTLTAADRAPLPNGKPTWWRNVQLERQRLLGEGKLSSECHEGEWKLGSSLVSSYFSARKSQ